MKLQVRHQTQYRYSARVSQAVNQLCLSPRSTHLQACLSSAINIIPEPDRMSTQVDIFGNAITRFSLDKPHSACTIVANSLVETSDALPALPASPSLNAMAECLPSVQGRDRLISADCLLPTRYVPRLQAVDELIRLLAVDDCEVLTFATRLMSHIYQEFDYDPTFSTLVTPVSEVLAARRGVCQDFAHLALAVLRRAGIPARYVSGYLETLPPPGKSKLRGSNASHAWFAIFVPGQGWFDFDPTNNKRPDAQYVTTAWGRDFSDVSPVKGVVFGGGTHKLSVAVDVDRLDSPVDAI